MSRISDKGDVFWYLPKRKRPFEYSTIATEHFIQLLAAEGGTIKQCREKIGRKYLQDPDAERILDEYIKRGYGDRVAKKFFWLGDFV